MDNIIKFPTRYTIGDVVSIYNAAREPYKATVLAQRGLWLHVIDDNELTQWVSINSVDVDTQKLAA